MDELDKKWSHIVKRYGSTIQKQMVRALESASHIGVGIIVVKKDNGGGYFIRNKIWSDIGKKERAMLRDELKVIGALGPLGGDPSDHRGS